MLDNLVQQFAGGGSDLNGAELHGGVTKLFEGASGQHSSGAISGALSSLGGSGFGQSVQEGAASGTPQARSGLAGILLNSVTQGGGSADDVASNLGVDPQNPSPEGLGALAEHVATNHPDALAGALSGQLGGGGDTGGVMSMLGNPMVRQMGTQLAQKLM